MLPSACVCQNKNGVWTPMVRTWFLHLLAEICRRQWHENPNLCQYNLCPNNPSRFTYIWFSNQIPIPFSEMTKFKSSLHFPSCSPHDTLILTCISLNYWVLHLSQYASFRVFSIIHSVSHMNFNLSVLLLIFHYHISTKG